MHVAGFRGVEGVPDVLCPATLGAMMGLLEEIGALLWARAGFDGLIAHGYLVPWTGDPSVEPSWAELLVQALEAAP